MKLAHIRYTYNDIWWILLCVEHATYNMHTFDDPTISRESRKWAVKSRNVPFSWNFKVSTFSLGHHNTNESHWRLVANSTVYFGYNLIFIYICSIYLNYFFAHALPINIYVFIVVTSLHSEDEYIDDFGWLNTMKLYLLIKE